MGGIKEQQPLGRWKRAFDGGFERTPSCPRFYEARGRRTRRVRGGRRDCGLGRRPTATSLRAATVEVGRELFIRSVDTADLRVLLPFSLRLYFCAPRGSERDSRR